MREYDLNAEWYASEHVEQTGVLEATALASSIPRESLVLDIGCGNRIPITKTESDAQKAVDALRLTINEQTPRQQLKEISFETLVQRYRQHETPDIFYKKSKLPEDVAADTDRKSFATQDTSFHRFFPTLIAKLHLLADHCQNFRNDIAS